MPKLTVAERRAALVSSLASFASSWDVEGAEVGLKLDDDRCVAVRAVRNGDERALCKFGLEGLSDASRALYGPYDWKSPDLEALFTESIENSRSRRDLHLVALDEMDNIVAHGFLWAANTPVPELGVAVADAFHGCGLGRCVLLLLETAATNLGCRAIELTTVPTNERARRAYESVGYQVLGVIRNPVGCDVTAAFAGTATPTHCVDELQMVRVLDENHCLAILAELAAKRKRAAELFGPSEGVKS